MLKGWNEKFRFYGIVALLLMLAAGLSVRLALLHWALVETPRAPSYGFTHSEQGLRGAIYSKNGRGYPFAYSLPVWVYGIDPTSFNEQKFDREEIVAHIAEQLKIPAEKVRAAYARAGTRYVKLIESYDCEAHSNLVAMTSDLLRPELKKKKRTATMVETGLAIGEKQLRVYPQGRSLAHVVGYVLKDPTNAVGAAGVELRYEKDLREIAGMVAGERDAQRVEIRRQRRISAEATPGRDVYLTVDLNLQYDVERALAEGVATSRAECGWCIILDVRTGAVLSMANVPDYAPDNFQKYSDANRINRAVSEVYEPGSVMKTITACAVLNEGIATPDTPVNTSRGEAGYYRLPGDAGHVWPATMSVRDALVHSSNIVYGKLGVKLGPKRLWSYMRAFGLGAKTGIDLPGEEAGLLPDWQRWDKIKWSRAPIGQGVAITAIQLVRAYAAIANDGVLMEPYVVEKIVDEDGETVYTHEPRVVGRPIRAETAQKVREMMLGVATRGGTARQAAIKGYSVAGKTGTAQMKEGRGYSERNFNASFVGMLPASKPEIVVLVTLQKPFFCRSFNLSKETGIPLYNHQGGVCAAPTFRAIAEKALRYLAIPPDRPEEIPEAEAEVN